MFIKRTTDIRDILRVVPVETKLREKEKAEAKTDDFLAFVQTQLTNPLFYFIMIFEDETEKNLMGYLVLLATPIKVMGSKQVNVIRGYYDPKYRKLKMFDVLWGITEEIAKMYKIKKVVIGVTRGVRAFQKLGFKKSATTIMERGVG